MTKKILSIFFVLCMAITGSSFAFAADSSIQSGVTSEELISASSEKNDLVYSGKDAEMDAMFDELIIKIREFKQKNPSASNEMLEANTKKLLKNAGKKDKNNQQSDLISGAVITSVSADLDTYISGYLNPLEKQLYESNKTKGLLCISNGKLAIEYAELNYQSTVLKNGNGDAFRHCLWNFGMAIDVGQTFAKQWSDAHENGVPNNPALEKQMDLFNNAVGLKLANDNPSTILHSTFISKSKEKCRNGELRIISNNKLVSSSNVGEK